MSAPDVRCLQYMPLQIERLRRSKAWLRCKRRPEMAFYLMNLWMRAWHELPAGSLEDDDDVLADAAMCDPNDWALIRADVLAGWELRDGRYHHPVVTELATEAESKLRKNVTRTAAAREALARKQSESIDNPVTDPVTETVTSHEGKGREGKKEEPSSEGSTRPKRKLGTTTPEDFIAKPRHYEMATAKGFAPEWVDEQVQRMRSWSQANENREVARKSDWDAALDSWLRKQIEDANSKRMNGGSNVREGHSVVAAARQMLAHSRQLDERERPALLQIGRH